MTRSGKLRFIINPISGIGRQRTIEKQVGQHIDTSRFEPEFVYTQQRGHAIELAKTAANESVAAVVAVGGDGSVNEVGQALVDTETALAIIPTGSGNGLARHLNLPLDIAGALQRINAFETDRIDTVELNGMPYLGVAGVGFDAHIAREFDHFGQRGFISYVRLISREVTRYKPANYRIEVDGKKIERTAFVLTAANSSQYGNGAQIAPMASIQDGIIDLCIVKPFPAVLIPEMVLRMFRGNIHKTKYVEVLQGSEIKIEQSGTIAHLDGEPVEPGHHLHIKIKPLSLKVVR